MSTESRAADLVRRREALGYPNPHRWAKATGRDYDTIKRAEAGEASDATYDWLEAWLDRNEPGGTVEPEEDPGLLHIKLTNVYSEGGIRIDEVIASGGDGAEVAEMLGKVLDRLNRRDPE